MIRSAVAVLFLASVVAAGVVDARREGSAAPAALATTTTTGAPTSTTAAATTTTAVPTTPAPAPTTAAPATTAPATVPPAAAGAAKVIVSPRGIVLPVTSREGDAYRVITPCGRSAVATGTPVAEAAVVLDAGHGGKEPGAVGPGQLTEKAVNLAVVEYARAALTEAGVSVVLTRTADYRITLNSRAEIVKALDPRAFVSVHHNAEPDGPRDGPGTETYYQIASPESKRLSGLIYEEVVKALSAYKIAWVADTDAGAKYRRNVAGDDYYGILRRTQGTPASLAELGFISNPPEEELLRRPEFQQVEGEAVARAVLRFLNTKDPGSGFVEPYPRESPAGSGGGTSNCVDPAL